MTLFTRPRLLGLILAALVCFADQWLKWLIAVHWRLDDVGDQIVLTSFFNLTRTNNLGVSLGMLTADTAEMRWLLVALTGGIALVVLVWMFMEKLAADVLPLALVLGGALGNIIDRVRLGHVVDYADLHFGEWRPFLVFNLADAAITLGVLFILARSFLSREKRADHAAEPATEN